MGTEKQVQDRQLKRLLSENQDLLEQIDSLDNALKSSKEEVISLSKENQNLEAKCQNSVAENICSKQKIKDLECQIAAQLEKKEFETKTFSEEIETKKSDLEMAKRNLQEDKQKLELDRKEMD